MTSPSTSVRQAPLTHRYSFEEGKVLFEKTPLLELGALALEAKKRFYSEQDPITFVIDRNVNYTNICNVDCMFCAFYRHADDADAYVLPYETIAQKAQELLEAEGTQFLLQGGVNPNLPFDYYTQLLRRLKADFPKLTLHAFSTSEIAFMAKLTEKPLSWVLGQLIEAGLDSIPGAGAEILHDDVRRKVSPKKVNTADWLEVMEEAHKLGLKTTATMMFGMTEEPWHIVDHLIRLRDLQEKYQGFTAFIPWTFQAANTRLAKLPVESLATGVDFLKVIALSRLLLDNIANIQSSWLTQGTKLCQAALAFGANDLGGIILEENVVTEAGIRRESQSAQTLIAMCHEAGYDAAQRNTRYEILKRYPRSR
jgi:cyclic dehypoxanthinyl futalosine synthase